MPKQCAPNEPAGERELATTDDRNTNRPLFDWLSRFFGVSLGFVYLVGFLVVTRHLSRYGVSSFSIFQLQYLVAGAWVIAPFALMGLMHTASQRFERRALSVQSEDEEISWRRRLVVAGVTNIPGGLAMCALAVFVGKIEGVSWSTAALLSAFYLALMFSAELLWASWKTPKHTWWVNRQASPFYATLLISIFLVYVFFFAMRVYPLIPYSLGGGKPLTVAFLLGEKKIPDFLARDSSSYRSLPYKLLAATDKTFVILPSDPSQTSIEFNRDTVLGVAVLKESLTH